MVGKTTWGGPRYHNLTAWALRVILIADPQGPTRLRKVYEKTNQQAVIRC